MRYKGIRRVQVDLSESDVEENRIHFDQKTLSILEVPDLRLIQIEGEKKEQWIRLDDFGHGARTEGLNFVSSNYDHLLKKNRRIEIEVISRSPYILKFHRVE